MEWLIIGLAVWLAGSLTIGTAHEACDDCRTPLRKGLCPHCNENGG